MADEKIWRVGVRQSQAGVTYESSFHLSTVENDDVFIDSSEDQLTLLNGEWESAHGAHVSLDGYSLQKVYDTTEIADVPGPSTLVGSSTVGTRDLFTFQPLAVWLCMLMRVPTSVGGRRAKGRAFWSPLTEGDISGETILTGAGSAVEGMQSWIDELWNIFDPEFGTSTSKLCCFSPTSAGQGNESHSHPYGGLEFDDVAVLANKPTLSLRLTTNRSRRA